jgi:DNA-binding response OmpR family regulator
MRGTYVEEFFMSDNNRLGLGRPLVYFVDDEPDILDVFESYFADRFDVIVFQSPEEAVKAATDPMQRKPDAIVTDFRMPRLSGIEMLARIRAAGNDCRAILLSGNVDKDVAIAAANKGIFQILEKPFDGEEVATALELLLNEERADSVRKNIRSQMLRLKEMYSAMRLLMTSRVPEFDDILHELLVDPAAPTASGSFETMLEDLEFNLERLIENENGLVSKKRAS